LNVLIIKGSPQISGNTHKLADAFAKDAKEAGSQVNESVLKKLDIKDCLGCCACQRNGGTCVQKDDMQEVYEKIREADHIVFATPVYFYNYTSLLKRTMDRMFALDQNLIGKKFSMIVTGAAPNECWQSLLKQTFEKFLSCFRNEDNRVGYFLYGCASDGADSKLFQKAMEAAYEAEKNNKEMAVSFLRKDSIISIRPTAICRDAVRLRYGRLLPNVTQENPLSLPIN